MFSNTNIVSKIWNMLFNPEIRLKADFPWSFGKMAKQYVIATVLYLVGTFVPVIALMFAFGIAVQHYPHLADYVVDLSTNKPTMLAIVVPVLISFLCGFGLELWYINRCFKKEGLSLTKSMGLNLNSLGGSWWSAIWRALVAFGVVLAVNALLSLLPLPKAEGPAEQIVKSLSGWGFLAFGVLAVIAAPIFEEFVFRGFLFNVCRTSFRKGFFWKIFRTERIADYAAIAVSAFCFAAGHMSLSGLPALFIMGCLLATLYRRSGSLVCPMILHAINNCFAMVMLYIQLHG